MGFFKVFPFVVSAGCFLAGALSATAYYKTEIAEMRADYDQRAKAQAEQNLRESEENARRLAQAMAERDDALKRYGALSDDAKRVREQSVTFGLKMPAGGADSCKPCREKLAQSVKLLAEGADLLAEGADLLIRVSADKDALAQISLKK